MQRLHLPITHTLHQGKDPHNPSPQTTPTPQSVTNPGHLLITQTSHHPHQLTRQTSFFFFFFFISPLSRSRKNNTFLFHISPPNPNFLHHFLQEFFLSSKYPSNGTIFEALVPLHPPNPHIVLKL